MRAAETPEAIRARLRALERAHPCIAKLVRLGESHGGRGIWALALGRGSDAGKPAVLLDGGHHGDEPLTVSFVLDAAEHILARAGRDVRVDRWLDQLVVWAVPLVNPDGLVHGTRKNGRDNDGDGTIGAADGVDLNRNYPFRWGFLGEVGSSSGSTMRSYRGPEPGSEPEVRAMMRLAGAEVFASGISYHYGAVAWLVPYTIERVADPTPNEAWPIARKIAATLPLHPQAHAAGCFPVRRNLYPVDGTSQDWLRAHHGTLAYIVEGGLRGGAHAGEIVAAMRPTWMGLLDRTVAGPVIVGRVVDEHDSPVAAEVHVEGTTLREHESWRSRCRDGAFTRYVAAPGTYRLRVRVEGEEPIVQPVEVGTGPARVTVRVRRGGPGPCAMLRPRPRER